MARGENWSGDQSRDAMMPVASGDPAIAFARHLKDLFDGLGMSQRAYAARYHYDPSTISRYLSAERLPDEEFIKKLLGAIEELRGAPVTAALREQTGRLWREALRVRNPAQHRVQMLTDQLAEAKTQLQQAEMREHVVLQELDAQQSRAAELDRQLQQLAQDRAASQQTRQRLEEEHDRLLRTIGGLYQELSHAHEQRRQAEEGYKQADRALRLVEEALHNAAGSPSHDVLLPIRSPASPPIKQRPPVPPLGAIGAGTLVMAAFVSATFTASGLMVDTTSALAPGLVYVLPGSLALGWLGGGLLGLSLSFLVGFTGERVNVGRIVAVDAASIASIGIIVGIDSRLLGIAVLTAYLGLGIAMWIVRMLYQKTEPAPEPKPNSQARQSFVMSFGHGSTQTRPWKVTLRPARRKPHRRVSGPQRSLDAAALGLANGTRAALGCGIGGLVAGLALSASLFTGASVAARVLVVAGYLAGIGSWLYAIFTTRDLVPQRLRRWMKHLQRLLARRARLALTTLQRWSKAIRRQHR